MSRYAADAIVLSFVIATSVAADAAAQTPSRIELVLPPSAAAETTAAALRAVAVALAWPVTVLIGIILLRGPLTTFLVP